jgi:restriction system protein
MMLLFAAAVILLFGSGCYKYWLKERELDSLRSHSLKVWETNRHIQRTLATGLYFRFAGDKETGLSEGGGSEPSSLYIRSNPYEFAYFVSDILEGIYGGQAYVTQSDGGTGVDIEHERKDGLYLIQVRTSRTDTDAEAVAVLHSQVVRRKAVTGWIVATGGFTDAAKRYAAETELVWVDGIRLVQLWGEYLDLLDRRGQTEEPERETPFRPATV